jgi:hypothetical protein
MRALLLALALVLSSTACAHGYDRGYSDHRGYSRNYGHHRYGHYRQFRSHGYRGGHYGRRHFGYRDYGHRGRQVVVVVVKKH